MRAAWRVAAVERGLLEIEHRVRFRDGSWRHVLTRGVPILGPAEDGEPGRLLSWVGTSADIEMRKLAEIELQRLNETLERRVVDRTTELADTNRQLLRQIEERARAEEALRHAQKMEAVGQLTGGVAHDFNNLLTVVMGGLDLIMRQVSREGVARPERIRSAAESAMQGARRAATLTHRLLAFSRRQSLDPRPIDANQLVLGMSDMLRRTLGEGVALHTELAAELWPTEADPNQLENALLNLAVNARDAMPEGGRLSITTANVELGDGIAEAEGVAGQFVAIVVSDSGTGMDEATIQRAFEPFFTTKDVGQGTGLGLSQVYGFVRQSSGHVRLDSTLGEGTTVRIYLPRREPRDRAEEIAPVPVAPPRADGESVLVVEDDAAVREYSTHCMRELGYIVLEAPSGAAALTILERNPQIGLLFTDIGLPGGMNGRELAERAVRRRPGLKVLFTSGYALPAFLTDAPAGALHLLPKPFTAADLGGKLRQVLGKG
jgi:signal transduction histidine kinase